MSMNFALNHITVPQLHFAQILDLATALGIEAVEIRNDLPGVEIADGTAAEAIRREAEARGVTILTINALYPFDVWNVELAEKARRLAAYARDCGAQALVMCPLNSREDERGPERRAADLRTSLTRLMPILHDHGVAGFVEPLGFLECSLRTKAAAVAAIEDVGGAETYKLVHDTFHHYLAAERACFPDRTGLVHISGVEDTGLPMAEIRDGHRVLVGAADIMDNAGQIAALRRLGYAGPFSFEPFATSVHKLPDPAGALHASIEFITRAVDTGR